MQTIQTLVAMMALAPTAFVAQQPTSQKPIEALEEIVDKLDTSFPVYDQKLWKGYNISSTTENFDVHELLSSDVLITIKSFQGCAGCEVAKREAKHLRESYDGTADINILVYDGLRFITPDKDPLANTNAFPEITVTRNANIVHAPFESMNDVRNFVRTQYGVVVADSFTTENGIAKLGYDVTTDAPFILDAIARNKTVTYVTDKSGNYYGFEIMTNLDDPVELTTAIHSDAPEVKSYGRDSFSTDIGHLSHKRQLERIELPQSNQLSELLTYIQTEDKDRFEAFRKQRGMHRSNGFNIESLLQNGSIATDFTSDDKKQWSGNAHFLNEYLARSFFQLPEDMQSIATQFFDDFEQAVVQAVTQSGQASITSLYDQTANWELLLPTKEQLQRYMHSQRALVQSQPRNDLASFDAVTSSLNEAHNLLKQAYENPNINVVFPKKQTHAAANISEGKDIVATVYGANMMQVRKAYDVLQTISQQLPEDDQTELHLVFMPYTTTTLFPRAGYAQPVYAAFDPGRVAPTITLLSDGVWQKGTVDENKFQNPSRYMRVSYNPNQMIQAITNGIDK